MTFFSTTAPSIKCYAGQLAGLAQDVPGQAELISEQDDCGYALVNDYVVPFSFFTRVAEHIMFIPFEYGTTFSPREVVGDAFWQTLDACERSVLGHCLLILIEQGRIVLCFPESAEV